MLSRKKFVWFVLLLKLSLQQVRTSLKESVTLCPDWKKKHIFNKINNQAYEAINSDSYKILKQTLP